MKLYKTLLLVAALLITHAASNKCANIGEIQHIGCWTVEGGDDICIHHNGTHFVEDGTHFEPVWVTKVKYRRDKAKVKISRMREGARRIYERIRDIARGPRGAEHHVENFDLSYDDGGVINLDVSSVPSVPGQTYCVYNRVTEDEGHQMIEAMADNMHEYEFLEMQAGFERAGGFLPHSDINIHRLGHN